MTTETMDSGEVSQEFEQGQEEISLEQMEQEEGGVDQPAQPEATEAEVEEPKEAQIERNMKYALKEEREKRKETERTLEQIRQQNALMEQRFQYIMQQMAPKQEAPKIPSLEEDPVGHFRAKQEMLEQQLAQQQQVEQYRQQQTVQQQQEQQFLEQYRAAAIDYSTQQRDFNEAYSFLTQGRYQELVEFGLSPAEAAATVQQDERYLVGLAMQQGKNPAESLYKLARQRGFKGAQAQTPAQQIQAVKKGQQAAKPVPGANSTQPKLTLESLAAMDDAEFAKNFDKVMRGT